MNKKIGITGIKSLLHKNLLCRGCGASWENTSKKTKIKCPYCGKKKDTRDRREYARIYNSSEKRIREIKEYRAKWRANKENEEKRKNNQQILLKKKIFFKIYGSINPKCARCGCNDIRFLEVNHKKGGGGKEIQEKGYSRFIGEIIHDKRKVDDLEMLCRPCNAIHYLESKFGEIPMKVLWKS